MTTSLLWSLLVIATLSLFVSGTPLERSDAESFNEVGRIVNGREAKIGIAIYDVTSLSLHKFFDSYSKLET